MPRKAKVAVVSPTPSTSQTSPVDRQPSEVEKKFIVEHYVKDRLTPDQLYAQLPGVDHAGIDACISSLLPDMKQGQTAQDRFQQLGKVQGPVGQFMGRDTKNGVVVMTEAASELSDARKVIAVPSNDAMVRAQADKIHIINPDKRTR